MHARDKGQFAQFFEEVEEQAHTPSKSTSRFAPSPSSRLSVADLEKTATTMTPRMEIMLRKEQKAREEAANLTFKPHVNRNGNSNPHSATKSTSKDQSNRFDALYSDALKRHLETKWKESADEKDLTFQPKINERGRGASRAGSRVGSRASSKEREAVPTTESAVERLHATPKGKLKHGVDPDNKLTFKPEITKRAMSIDRKESAKRLYVSNSLEKEKTKALLRENEVKERELENCTFSPKLITQQKATPRAKVDLNERMSKFEEMKRAKIQEAQRLQEEKELADVTFKPVLKAKAKRAPTPTKPFHERLAQPHERQVPVEITNELNAAMTFKPTLVSKRAVSPNGRANEYHSVHERLFKEGEARKKETQLAMEAMKYENETSFTFSPEINHTSKVASGELGPVFERLATSTSKQYMQEVLMKVKTELELKDCTFHPKLSTEGHRYVPKDKEVDALPVHERLNAEAEAKRIEKERIESERKEELVRRHSFTPQIPEASKSMISTRSFTSPSGGGSVSGNDDIFSRLNAQTTIAKSPMVRNGSMSMDEASVASQSPQRTRSSIVLTEAEHTSLYDRLSATPRSLTFKERSNSIDPNDDRASSVNRRSQAEIDNVINRLHSSHTKAMKAPAFEDPTSFHTLLRTNSMSSNGGTPNGSPDKASQQRKSFSSNDGPPMSFGGASPLRRSASMSMPSPMARSNSISGMSPSAAAPSPMSRHGSIRVASSASYAAAAAPADDTPVKASPAPASRGSFIRKPSEESPAAPAAPAAAPLPKAVVRVPSASAVVPPPAPVAAPVATLKPASKPAPKSSGDDFMAKIEASMNMLQMNPADVVAQHRAATPPVPAAAVAAPAPAPAAVVSAPETTNTTAESGDEEEVEAVDSLDNL